MNELIFFSGVLIRFLASGMKLLINKLDLVGLIQMANQHP